MSVSAKITAKIGDLNLDLQIDAADGESVALLGANGTGKTTTLKVLAGLLPVAMGTVVIDGLTVDDPVRRIFVPAESRSIGYCPQDLVLFPNLSVLENVAFAPRARGEKRSSAFESALAMLGRLGGSSFADSKPSALSVGQCQRVALARALVASNRLLLLDEPTSAIDADSRPSIHGVINDVVRASGATLVVVTHDRHEAHALAQRVIEMGQ